MLQKEPEKVFIDLIFCALADPVEEADKAGKS